MHKKYAAALKMTRPPFTNRIAATSHRRLF
jgi:hypothetical protein